MNADRQVLIVDDDSDIREGTYLRLKAAGYRPITASDGEEGFASALENHPDAIVLDVRMPRVDGLTALAAGSGDVGAAGLGVSGSGEAVATNGPDRVMTVAGGSLIEEYGPWLAVGAAGLVVLVGCVLTLRSRR